MTVLFVGSPTRSEWKKLSEVAKKILLNSKREKDLQAWEARLRQKEVEVNDKLERAEKMLRDAEVVTRDGLPTKDPERASTSRVLGLQLYKADELTRIPLDWVKRFKARYAADVACASRQCVVGPVSLEQIARAQEDCPDIVETIRELQCDLPVTSTAFKMVRDQLILQNDVLMRSVKLRLDGTVVVPVVPDTLRGDVLQSAHVNSGHGSWETMYNILRRRCYFPGMASACHQFVQQCRSCISASIRRGPSAAPTRPDIPGRPWCEVTLDTLELGPDRWSLSLRSGLCQFIHEVGGSRPLASS